MAAAVADARCTACEAVETPVWRRDKESRARLCNRCYIKKYVPTPSTSAGLTQVKKENLDVEGLKQEVKEQPKEYVKEEQNAEAELKAELPVEVKQEPEVKKEAKDASPESEVNGKRVLDGVSKGDDENKRQKVSGEEDDGFDLSELMVETDNEYPDIDVTDCVQAIRIEASGKSSMDGRYERMPVPCRGRPAWKLKGAKKVMYLFWNRRWIIGEQFGKMKKTYAQLKCVGLQDPCEPYPSTWKTKTKAEDGEKAHFEKAVAMRCYDAAVEEVMRSSMPAPRLQEASRHRKKPDKPESAAKATDAAGAEGAKAPQQAVEQVSSNDSGSGSSDEESKKSEGKSSKSSASSKSSKSSGSDDDEDSSDAGVPASPQPQAAQAAQSPAAKAGAVANKAIAFEDRLRSELTKQQAAGDPAALRSKLQKIREQLSSRAGNMMQLAGMNELQVKELLNRLERDFESVGAAQKPKQPPGPPPKHLLVPQPPGPPPGHLLQATGAGSAPPVQDAPVAQPTTPVEMTDGVTELLPHRRPVHSLRSSMKGRFPRRRDGARIEWQLTAAHMPVATEAPIASYRGAGDLLWFQQPGAVVFCDRCGEQVPQSTGNLMGAPQQSQFAQNMFVCNGCQQNPGYAYDG